MMEDIKMNGNKKVVAMGGQRQGDKKGMMQSPCTISECVQIARGVVDDAISDYHQNQGNIQLSMSIQIELLKEILFSSGMITEEEFRQKYMEKAKELQRIQMERMSNLNDEQSKVTASMTGEVGDIEIKTEE